MELPANLGRIDTLLNPWRPAIGAAFEGYRNHVVRMACFCQLLEPCDAIEQQKIEIAACFHDIGIWTAGTMDYLPPSAALAREYLDANGLHSSASNSCSIGAVGALMGGFAVGPGGGAPYHKSRLAGDAIALGQTG